MVSSAHQNHAIRVRPQSGETGTGVGVPPRQQHKF
jgi:hypothetical protein